MKPEPANFDQLVERITDLVQEARKHVRTTVNTTMVYTYYNIGHHIVEYEQGGLDRAEYGKYTIKLLSERLTKKFGDGWSPEQLTLTRKFYLVYSPRFNQSSKEIVNTVYDIIPPSHGDIPQNALQRTKFNDKISWSHYIQLMRIKNPDERHFYEIECAEQQWSVRELQRQYGSSLYERLALSRDKKEVKRLSREGHVVEKPTDILKNPLTLEFVGLRPEEAYTETKLEQAVLSKLRDFLLEMGKGFLFEARQKRFTFNEDHYFVDLVLYNRLLQAYVLIDFKTDKLTHQDLGQMQMYVNYYDRFVKQPFEKPTIGILVCKEKNEALVELTLPQDANIYAAEYALYLPDKKLLQAKLRQWISEEEDIDGSI